LCWGRRSLWAQHTRVERLQEVADNNETEIAGFLEKSRVLKMTTLVNKHERFSKAGQNQQLQKWTKRQRKSGYLLMALSFQTVIEDKSFASV
jgi:hypothetical protein